MISNQSILETVDAYTRRFPAEAAALAELRELVGAGGPVTSRKHTPGHITAGALLIRDDRLLVVRHKVFDIWVMPGGHIDETNESLRAAAQRELIEEAGVAEADLFLLSQWPGDLPLDIGRHSISPRPEKNEPAHIHWDIRYVFGTNVSDVRPQLSEVTDSEWRELGLVPDNLGPKLLATVASRG